MRKGSRPSSASGETCSKKRISSSMLMRPSRNELVAARFGHQDRGVGGVLLHLLAQPIDVGLERMGGDAGIIAPHLLQQDLARDRAPAGAIEIAQDRGLLFGQTHLVALGIDQELRAWPERVRADGEDRVLARFMLAELGANARKQHGETN